MNPLNLLKTQLQNALNESTETEDFKEALYDGIYATNLSVAGLESWMYLWDGSQDVEYMYGCGDNFSPEYQKGVKFVEDKWHQITGMF